MFIFVNCTDKSSSLEELLAVSVRNLKNCIFKNYLNPLSSIAIYRSKCSSENKAVHKIPPRNMNFNFSNKNNLLISRLVKIRKRKKPSKAFPMTGSTANYRHFSKQIIIECDP